MQQEIDIFNLAFVQMATGYVKRVAERTLKEEPEARGAAQQFRLELGDEVNLANLLAVTVGKLWDKMAQEPPKEPIQEPQKDGTEPVKLGPGVYLRMENAYVSPPGRQIGRLARERVGQAEKPLRVLQGNEYTRRDLGGTCLGN